MWELFVKISWLRNEHLPLYKNEYNDTAVVGLVIIVLYCIVYTWFKIVHHNLLRHYKPSTLSHWYKDSTFSCQHLLLLLSWPILGGFWPFDDHKKLSIAESPKLINAEQTVLYMVQKNLNLRDISRNVEKSEILLERIRRISAVNINIRSSWNLN